MTNDCTRTNTEEKTGFLLTLSCLFVIAALTVAFFYPALAGQKVFWGDIVLQDYPWRHFAATQIRDHEFPLWNPYNYSGMPFLADVQSAVLYPLNLVLALFVDGGSLSFAALQNQIIFHFFLAGAFMFALLRHFHLRRISCLIGSVSFMFCGFLVAHLGHVGMLNVAVWMPLVFLFFHKSLTERNCLSAVWGGLFFGICILGGHSQPALYMLSTMGLYLLWSVVTTLATRQPHRLRHSAAQIGLFALMLIVTFGIAAAQIIPMAELTQHSIRAEEGFDFATSYSLPPRHLITLLIPKFFGVTIPGQSEYWGEDNFTEMCVYVGILPLVLAALALVFRRNRETRFFGCIALFSIVMALGRYTPLYRFIYSLPTPLRLVRVPARFGYLLGFSTAVMAGFGADALVSPLTESARSFLRRLTRVLAALGVMTALSLFAFYAFWIGNSTTEQAWKYATATDQTLLFLLILLSCWLVLLLFVKRRLTTTTLGVSLLVVLVVDLFAFGSEYNLAEGTPNEVQNKRLPVVEYLKAELGTGRFEQTVGIPYNSGTRHDVFDVAGWNPFSLNDYHAFQRGVKKPKRPDMPEDEERLRYVLGVKFLAGKHLQAPKDIRTINGIRFDASQIESVGPEGEAPLLIDNLPVVLTNRIGMVSELGYAVETLQATQVAELEVQTFAGTTWRFPIRAGIESSEWACDFRDNLPYLKHVRANVAWEQTRSGIPARTFIAEFDLPELEYIRSLKVTPQDTQAVVNIYSFSLVDSMSGQSTPIGAGKLRFDRELGDITVLRTRTTLPRALLVHDMEWAESFEDAIEMVRDEAFLLNEKVILEAVPDQQVQIPLGMGVGELVQISAYRPNEVVIRVEAHAPGILVLNDVFYPGWRAYLDDRRVRLYQANGLMRAVAVPPGRHWVRMTYRPRLIKNAARLSFGTLLLVLILLLWRLLSWCKRMVAPLKRHTGTAQTQPLGKPRGGLAIHFSGKYRMKC